MITSFLDKGIQNNSAAERFNTAKPQYLIKWGGGKVKRGKNRRTLENKFHTSTNPRNNETKGKTNNHLSAY